MTVQSSECFDLPGSLDFSVCFQSFDEEQAELPGIIGAPRGRLILCEAEGRPGGCVALRPLGPTVCEMKRLYLRPEFRGRRLGLQLAGHVIQAVREIGFERMRLDEDKR
jgi:GNAT superfamily N-acetyltransferase